MMKYRASSYKIIVKRLMPYKKEFLWVLLYISNHPYLQTYPPPFHNPPPSCHFQPPTPL